MKNIILIAGLALFMFGCNDGRNHGANIPIDPIPTCDEQCGDVVCEIQGVEECFEDCEICEVCEVCEICETCEVCEVCPPPEPPVCFERVETCEWVKVCPRTFCRTWGGDCCTYEKQCTDEFVLVDCPEDLPTDH